MPKNFVSYDNAEDLMEGINAKKDVKPINITWADYIALTSEQRAGKKYIITGAPKSGISASDILYDNTTSELSSTNVNSAIDELAKPTFTEASTRANIASGEKLSTIFGKIKKWYTDLFKGSISVTADGTKRYKQLLSELSNLIDTTKLNGLSHIVINYGNGFKRYFIFDYNMGGNGFAFNSSHGIDWAEAIGLYPGTAGAENIYYQRYTSTGTTDFTPNVPTSGITITLYYGNE